MIRFKEFNATGIAPDGKLFAGDLTMFQDLVAALSDYTQTIDLSTLRVGSSDLQILKYGSAEFRMSGAVRTDGIVRGLGGFIPGAFTTTQRDAIASGLAPFGVAILNSTTGRWEYNDGTDGSRSWREFGPRITYGSSPPSSPKEGDLWILPADANGRLWAFRYNATSGSSFKWEFIGGNDLYAYVSTSQTTSSASYADMATVGPSITVPRAGDYTGEFGAILNHGASTNQALAAVVVNNVASSYAIANTTTGAVNSSSATREYIASGLAANDVVKLRYVSSNGTTLVTISERWLKIRPVRVS